MVSKCFHQVLTEQISCIVHLRAKFISFGNHGKHTQNVAGWDGFVTLVLGLAPCLHADD